MSGDLTAGNPTPWPAPPGPGEQRLRSTPMASPTVGAAGAGGGGTLQAALSSSPPPRAAANAVSSSSQQTLLRGSSSLSSATAAGANNGDEVTSANRSKETPSRRFLGGVVGLPGERAHHLRVRKRVPLADNLTAELGLGAELLSGEVTRHAALTYDVSSSGESRGVKRREGKKEKLSQNKTKNSTKQNKLQQFNLAGKHLVSLRASPGLLQVARSFRLSLPRSCASATVKIVAGLSNDGRPVFGFDVDDVGPPRLVAAAAAAALSAGTPLSAAKAVPLFTAGIPGLYVPWRASAEVRATAQRKEFAPGGSRAAAGASSSSSSSSSSLDLLSLDGGAGAGKRRDDSIFGPLTLDVKELSFVLDV